MQQKIDFLLELKSHSFFLAYFSTVLFVNSPKIIKQNDNNQHDQTAQRLVDRHIRQHLNEGQSVFGIFSKGKIFTL